MCVFDFVCIESKQCNSFNINNHRYIRLKNVIDPISFKPTVSAINLDLFMTYIGENSASLLEYIHTRR